GGRRRLVARRRGVRRRSASGALRDRGCDRAERGVAARTARRVPAGSGRAGAVRGGVPHGGRLSRVRRSDAAPRPVTTAKTELLVATLANLLEPLDPGTVAVGNVSPIPAAAALLWQARAPGRSVSVLGSRRHSAFTDGGRELFDCAAQGRIDAFFLGGGQIDGEANVNLVATDRHRFPGSFGSAYLYFLVPNVILFRAEHSRRVLVPRVDFVSAPRVTPPALYTPAGPIPLPTVPSL